MVDVSDDPTLDAETIAKMNKWAVGWPQKLRISIVIKPGNVKKVYPDTRDDVRFVTNTESLPLKAGIPAEPTLFPEHRPGKMFPGYTADLSEYPINFLGPAGQELTRERFDDLCNRKRSNSTQAIVEANGANPARWHGFNVIRPATPFRPEPCWTPWDQPFAEDPDASFYRQWEHQYRPELVYRIGNKRVRLCNEVAK